MAAFHGRQIRFAGLRIFSLVAAPAESSATRKPSFAATQMNGRGSGGGFRMRDKVIQTENDYDKDVFNGDIGTIERIDPDEHEVTIRFDERSVKYDFGELDEVSLAYAVTIHKSQGSEFPAVMIPIATQHYMLLQRNLIYTGITRGKKLVVLIGQKKALAIAVRNDRPQKRCSGLLTSLRGNGHRRVVS
jgi:exodeoxyribonuclease V alpha subunit